MIRIQLLQYKMERRLKDTLVGATIYLLSQISIYRMRHDVLTSPG